MKEFKSYSQAGQDRFAYELIGDKGTFLDIGANHPIEKNNTYGLEQIGWTGFLVEQDAHCVGLLRERRKSPVLQVDATTAKWGTLKPSKFNYISLDVDFGTSLALWALLDCGISCDVLTVEHDKYRFGPAPQDAMIQMLRNAGYKLICRDVCDKGLPFEDWWVSDWLFDKAERYEANGLDWKEIFNERLLR